MEPVILKSRQVRHDEHAGNRRGGAAGEACAEPEVRTLIEHGVVRAIEIVCACGETVTVQLEVQAEARPQSSAGVKA